MNSTAKRIALVGGLAVLTLGLGACTTLGQRHPVGNRAVPEPRKPVDLQRYLGRWYEIARYEQRFQKGCEGVTADYALRDDGAIEVLNRCRRPDGRESVARGRAKVVDGETGAKLKVSFFGPFYGDYWVLDRGDDYEWSIVGEPSGRYLWILSREATPGAPEIERLVRLVEELGYDTSYLRRTRQP